MIEEDVEISWLDYQKEIFFNWPDPVKYKIIPKGRRGGITKGGANAFIKLLLMDDGPLLWGDTVNGNIDRYFERYFYPVLDQNKIIHRFDRQAKKLTIDNQYADFRSADNPENWEGFAYKLIFLNEAGIILKDRDLYSKSVLPMLLDYPDSKLIAAGVPKGKTLRDGLEHPFYTLYKKAVSGDPRYQATTYTSYANPLLSIDDIKELEAAIAIFSPDQVRQEVNGEFIETDALNPFAHQYNASHHESTEAVFQKSKRIVISTDFNLNPFVTVNLVKHT